MTVLEGFFLPPPPPTYMYQAMIPVLFAYRKSSWPKMIKLKQLHHNDRKIKSGENNGQRAPDLMLPITRIHRPCKKNNVIITFKMATTDSSAP